MRSGDSFDLRMYSTCEYMYVPDTCRCTTFDMYARYKILINRVYVVLFVQYTKRYDIIAQLLDICDPSKSHRKELTTKSNDIRIITASDVKATSKSSLSEDVKATLIRIYSSPFCLSSTYDRDQQVTHKIIKNRKRIRGKKSCPSIRNPPHWTTTVQSSPPSGTS